MPKLPSASAKPALYRLVELFHEAFPSRRWCPFFQDLAKFAKRKLSVADRDIIIKASLRLLARKPYVETKEEYRERLKLDGKDRTELVKRLKSIRSSSKTIARDIEFIVSCDAWIIEKIFISS